MCVYTQTHVLRVGVDVVRSKSKGHTVKQYTRHAANNAESQQGSMDATQLRERPGATLTVKDASRTLPSSSLSVGLWKSSRAALIV